LGHIERSVQPAGGNSTAFVGMAFTKTAFYGTASDYREFPSERTFVACRGPWFMPCYDRYEFRLDGIRMPVTVIVPKTPAAGKPWVFRADFVTRDSVVDLALLGQGFHIVTGPIPTDTDGPVLSQWNAVYKHLTDAGLSKMPVLAGAGGAAGEAYAWAIENPDKVSCLYAENPILRSHMTKAQPLDRLAVLAKAGVPILHVCGSLDPWLDSETRVLEKRYKELGGRVTVLVEDGKGHFPTAPKDPKPVVDFIRGRQPSERSGRRPRDYRFDGTMSRAVLENQSKEYRANWLKYAWNWVRMTDRNGWLQMPGSRTMRSPLDGKRWYHANAPSPAVPDGLDDEEAIRTIWTAAAEA
jgi:hypothetical protein